MSLLYVDASVVVRAYISGEPEHADLRSLLLEGGRPIITSELVRLEFASAIARTRDQRASGARDELLARFAADCGPGGPIALISLQPESVLPKARDLVLRHRLRTLDAIHLAVAIEDGRPLARDTEFVFVTRDREQAAAARALGLTVR